MQSEDCTFYDRASRASRLSNSKGVKSVHQLTMDALRTDLENSENAIHNPAQTETLLGHSHIQNDQQGIVVNALHANGDSQLSGNHSNAGADAQGPPGLKWDEKLHVMIIRMLVRCKLMEYKLVTSVKEEVVESSVANLNGNPIIIESA